MRKQGGGSIALYLGHEPPLISAIKSDRTGVIRGVCVRGLRAVGCERSAAYLHLQDGKCRAMPRLEHHVQELGPYWLGVCDHVC